MSGAGDVSDAEVEATATKGVIWRGTGGMAAYHVPPPEAEHYRDIWLIPQYLKHHGSSSLILCSSQGGGQLEIGEADDRRRRFRETTGNNEAVDGLSILMKATNSVHS